MTVQFDPTLIADTTREAITGDQLVYVVDSSNIEARVLAWVAGHQSLLQQFRDKEDVYINFATKVYQRPLTKKLNPLERHVGKTCVLGLGFQVGWKKLQSSLATNDQFPMWVEEPECRHMVNLYRSDNSPVVDYWAAAELAIYDMYQGNERKWGALQIYKNALIMPNGMALQYPHLRPSEPDEQGRIGWEYWNGKFFTNLYGGKLTENIVQALSRIVLFRQMLKIDALFQSIHPQARVALSVHDEVVSVGPSFGAVYLGLDAKGKEIWSNTDGADALFAKQVEIMRTPEPWCQDLPLDGEGGFDFQYSK